MGAFLWGDLDKVRQLYLESYALGVVAQSPEAGAHDKNAQLFTIALLLILLYTFIIIMFFLFNVLNVTRYIKNIKKGEKRKIRFRLIQNLNIKYS